MEIRHVQHLHNRAGFGVSFAQLQRLSIQTKEQVVGQLFAESETSQTLEVANPVKRQKGEKPDREQLRMMRKKNREQVKDVNTAWMVQMGGSAAQLREKLTLFWHGHFACRSNNGYYAQQLNNVHRTHALGSFRDMLLEVARSPAMLLFLNNQQNRKQKPNENFSRELMELFTIGRGNYTEQDVKQAARAFTGWAFSPYTTEFAFRKRQHDFGNKTFMEKSGNFNGEDIIDIILQQKETAYFISEKLYRFLVNDKVNDEHVGELADTLFNNDYHIGKTLRKLFLSDWFYADENIGTKIKSPVGFIVAMNRTFGIQYEEESALLLMQRALGQILFYPPNVSGWPSGKSWIDSTTLMNRLRIPSLLLNKGEIELAGAADAEEEAQIAQNMNYKTQLRRKIKVKVDWQGFLSDLPDNMDEQGLINYLLPTGLSDEKKALLSTFDKENRKNVVIQLVSLPEYQMC